MPQTWTIHVFDEQKNATRDFTCEGTTLLSSMRSVSPSLHHTTPGSTGSLPPPSATATQVLPDAVRVHPGQAGGPGA